MTTDAKISNDPDVRRWHLVEEMAELAKELSKGARFGFDTPSPKDGTTPKERLLDEMDDVFKLMRLVKEDILNDRHPL